MKNITRIIAENIKHRRKEIGMTQEELSAKLGYSVKAVSKWECGHGAPPTIILPHLAHVLKTNVDLLLSEKSEEHFYLGIDGGGTKTEFALADDSGKIIKTLLLGTSNPSDIGLNASLEVLRTGIFEICTDLPKRSISLFAGLAGSSTEGVSDKIGAFLDSLGFAKAAHDSDAANAISAALGTKDGIIVIMGTGSVTFAQSHKRKHRIGGYGYLLGDAGSGFALGRDAILAALRYEDGSGAYTSLYDGVKARCEGKRVLEKLGSFYQGGKREIARYASLVFEAYRQNDSIARDILENNLSAVADTVRGAAKHLTQDVSIPLVLCGGICDANEDIIMPILQRMLATDSARYSISLCKHTLVYGALVLAGMPTKNE